MNNKLFDILRWIQVIIPFAGTLYAGVAAAWGWGYIEPVALTCTAITGFIGAILKKASHDYFKDYTIVPYELSEDEI